MANNCIIILNQLKTYRQMIAELNVKYNSYLDDQTRQKIRLVDELLSIIRNNIDILEFWFSSRHIKKIEFTWKIITFKKINFHRDYFGNILDFFKDYKMFYIQTQEKKSEEYLIYL